MQLTFAAIGNAFAVLSDGQKRKRYDDYGSAEPELRRRGHADGYEHDFSRGFEGKSVPAVFMLCFELLSSSLTICINCEVKCEYISPILFGC